MRQLLIWGCCCLFFGTFTPVIADSPAGTSLFKEFNSFRNQEALKHANWSVYVRDITENRDIIAHNIHQLLIPASTQKLLTTASAMMMLGHDHRFNTNLEYDGYINEEGTLHGNLYIRGDGDPCLGSAMMDDTLALIHVFEQWESAVRSAGIRAITGHVIADERIFDEEMVPRRWIWEHLGNYFGAGASGLTVNENEYSIHFNAGNRVGAAASVVYTKPEVSEMVFYNQVTTGPAGSGDQVYILGAPYVNERWLTGTVPLGATSFEVRGSLADPPVFIAESFLQHLFTHGVEVTGTATSYRLTATQGIETSDDRVNLATWHSPPLYEIIFRTNLSSINTYAENLLKTIGLQNAEQGSTNAGLKVIDEFWEKKDLDTASWILYDGSGLSPSNRLSTRHLMTVLYEASTHPTFSALIQSLPLAGYSGALKNWFRGTPSEGLLRAKSGYLNGARGYAGYTTMQNGNMAAFVVLVNDYQGPPASMRESMLSLMHAITLHDENSH
ncbi:MAG: D-alanyl-D-alanine carboxypeptidase/D-alanyl-D-alanine-endopeptidase [Bacteroidales bacterium]